MANLLNITGNLQGNKYTYTVSKHPENTKNSKFNNFGTSVCMYHDITGNCQIGAIQVAQKFVDFTVPEFRQFWNTIYYNKPQGWPTPWYKSNVVIDVHDRYVKRLIYRFEKMGAYIRLKTSYTNRTGSKMTMMVIDLAGKREGIDIPR